ncbi:MAG: hypothetical protein AAB587_02525 [Patescibacteria group bacterium]
MIHCYAGSTLQHQSEIQEIGGSMKSVDGAFHQNEMSMGREFFSGQRSSNFNIGEFEEPMRTRIIRHRAVLGPDMMACSILTMSRNPHCR